MSVHYDEQYCQWVQDSLTISSPYSYGEQLKSYTKVLTAGTIMLCAGEYFNVFFQLLEDTDISSLRGASYIAYEPGSLSPASIKVPTILFRNCRLPTVKEITKYNKTCTV